MVQVQQNKSDFHGSWRAIAIEAMMHGAFQILEQLHLGVEPVVENLGCFRGLLLLRIRRFKLNKKHICQDDNVNILVSALI